MRELLTDQPFTKADIITLQDPTHPERFDLSTFYYVKNKLSLDDGSVAHNVWTYYANQCLCIDELRPATQYLRTVNPETKAALESLAKEYKEPQVLYYSLSF